MDDLLNSAACGFVTFRDDGTIVEINQTLADMLLYSRHELLGWHLEKLLPAGGRIFYHTHVFPLLKLQGRVEEIYIALRSSEGFDIPVLFNGVRRERQGEMISECVVVRMIQRHQFEDQLLSARKLAEEANAAKAKFLSMMSHDLRTPLTTISGNAELFMAGVYGTLNKQQSEGIESIRGACQVLRAMIDDILEFAQIESGRVKVRTSVVLLSHAIERAVSLIRVQVADAGLSLETICDGDAAVAADPDKLQQILLNLLTNAVKFTPSGGMIAVSCESAGDRVRVSVRDTGIGIGSDDLLRIFSPFVQVDPGSSRLASSSRGVGLGLAISRDLARAMNGDVTAESTPGSGSIFTVELPAAESLASTMG